MKLSTKTKYGLRLMLDLANHFGEKAILLKEIARRQEISEKYLWHLASELKHAGLINSLRGCHGGYVLAKSPEKISLREIVCALEGQIALVDVAQPANMRGSDYAARNVWQQISEKILSMLDVVTLKELTQRQYEQTNVPNYQI